MKKCSECDCEMIDNCKIVGSKAFETGVDKRVDMSIHVPTGEKGNFLGVPYDITDQYLLKSRICPKCGKIELYANILD